MESTNAPLMIIDSRTEYGFCAIDPLEDTWIEARPVLEPLRGHEEIPMLRSRGVDLEIWFVSLDWLIGRHCAP